MIRTFQLPVPPEGVDPADPGWDDAAIAAAFARFLELLRFLVAGQSSIRADPAWASQLALVQGMAAAWPPDRLLREERLAEDLARARGAGRAGGAAARAHRSPCGAARRASTGPTSTRSARAAVEKDYVAFGFGALAARLRGGPPQAARWAGPSVRIVCSVAGSAFERSFWQVAGSRMVRLTSASALRCSTPEVAGARRQNTRSTGWRSTASKSIGRSSRRNSPRTRSSPAQPGVGQGHAVPHAGRPHALAGDQRLADRAGLEPEGPGRHLAQVLEQPPLARDGAPCTLTPSGRRISESRISAPRGRPRAGAAPAAGAARGASCGSIQPMVPSSRR